MLTTGGAMAGVDIVSNAIVVISIVSTHTIQCLVSRIIGYTSRPI